MQNPERQASTEPSLIVLFGNTSKKRFALTQSAMILGRARGCDIELEAPNVSSVHCIITKTPTTIHVRDCNSRIGIRVNGERVPEAFLHSADVLQVGPFSFEVHMDTTEQMLEINTCVSATKRRILRLEMARQRLTKLAMRLRQKSHQANRQRISSEQQTVLDEIELRKSLLERQEAAVRHQFHDLDQRERLLGDGQRKLQSERDTLQSERAELQAEIVVLRQSHQGEQSKEVELLQLQLNDARNHLTVAQAKVEGDQIVSRQLQEQLEALQAQLTQEREEVARERDAMAVERQHFEQRVRQIETEFADCHQQIEREHVENCARMGEQQRKLDAQEECLADQKMQVTEQILELQAGRAEVEREKRKVEHAQEEVAARWLQIAELEKQAVATAQQDGQREQLAAMLDLFQELCAGYQERQNAELAAIRAAREQLDSLSRPCDSESALHHTPGGEHDTIVEEAISDTVYAEIVALRTRLHEKEAEIDRLRTQRLSQPIGDGELASYENELNDLRGQITREKQLLAEDARAIEQRQRDLDQAARDQEIELSKERAKLAQERAHLAHLREEIRQERELFDRDPELQSRLAPVERLKEELMEQWRQDGETPPPQSAKGPRVQERLTGFLGRIREPRV